MYSVGWGIRCKNKERMEVSMCSVTETLMKEMLLKSGRGIVIELSREYGFDKDEGLKHLNLEGRKVEVSSGEKKKVQCKIPLPFCGVKCETNCNAIRLNHGLYTQCTNEVEVDEEGNTLCKTCFKQTEKNSNGKPTYGYIDDRVELGEKFRDPKGKPPAQYGNIMEKLKISQDEAEKEATKQGLTIPKDQFEIKKVRRGRPKKDTTTVDTSGSEEEPQKKPRGRPKKEKQVVSVSAGEELIKELVAEKEAQTVDTIELPPPPHVETSSDSDDEEELAVTEFKIGGVKYLKSADNTIYDLKTHEEIGSWNPKTKQIELEDDD